MKPEFVYTQLPLSLTSQSGLAFKMCSTEMHLHLIMKHYSALSSCLQCTHTLNLMLKSFCPLSTHLMIKSDVLLQTWIVWKRCGWIGVEKFCCALPDFLQQLHMILQEGKRSSKWRCICTSLVCALTHNSIFSTGLLQLEIYALDLFWARKNPQREIKKLLEFSCC